MNVALAEISDIRCENCDGDRRVWNPFTRRKMRCPRCTKPRPNQRAMREFTQRCVAAAREQKAITVLPVRQITGIAWVVGRLYEWGRFVRDRGIGYPHMAATEQARIGRGGGQDVVTPFPPDLEAIDRAVSAAPTDYKTILVEHYTKNGYVTEKAARLGIHRSTYYERKEKAELHIANALGV